MTITIKDDDQDDDEDDYKDEDDEDDYNDKNLVEVWRLRGCEISLELRVLFPSLIAGVLLTSCEILFLTQFLGSCHSGSRLGEF